MLAASELSEDKPVSTATMRAAVLSEPGRIRIDEVAVPEPGPGEVRVRLEGCGVCASNLTPWAGPEWMEVPTEPGELGHQGWGTSDAVGKAVEDLKVGDRLTAHITESVVIAATREP